MNSNPPSLRNILTALEQRLDRLSDAELRQALLTHAANLPAQEHSNFLDSFTFLLRDSALQLAPAQLPQAARDTSWPIDSDPLLTENDDFTDPYVIFHLPILAGRQVSRQWEPRNTTKHLVKVQD